VCCVERKNYKNEKRKKYFGRYLLMDFTQEAGGASQCPVCTEILQNISAAPSKLKSYFEKSTVNINVSLNFFSN
jgi:hypothetical protein